MTEIVDERQRLVARLRTYSWHDAADNIFGDAADQIEADGKRLAALASPSEGNKKGDETPAARWRDEGKPDPHGTGYDCERAQLAGGYLTDDEAANKVAMLLRSDLDFEATLTIAKDRIRWLSRSLVRALASRPQEQPRNDVDAAVKAAVDLAENYEPSGVIVPRKATGEGQTSEPALQAVLDKIFSDPAAAPGWQPRETAPKNGTLEWRVLMHWRDMGSSSGWVLTEMTHWRPAAPSSPAAQEQEKGEPT